MIRIPLTMAQAMAYQSLMNSLAAPRAVREQATEAIKAHIAENSFIQQQNATLSRATGQIEGLESALALMLEAIGVPKDAPVRIEFDNGQPILVANTEVAKQ